MREEVDQLDDVDGDRTVGMCFGREWAVFGLLALEFGPVRKRINGVLAEREILSSQAEPVGLQSFVDQEGVFEYDRSFFWKETLSIRMITSSRTLA